MKQHNIEIYRKKAIKRENRPFGINERRLINFRQGFDKYLYREISKILTLKEG